jgi:tRNA nucleotidyltransferase (CCA-adding enzyme)
LKIDVAETNSETTFSSDIVVIDPTDPSRNVADALSIEKAAEFQYYAREFLKQPSESFFKQEKQTLPAKKITEKMDQRGTEFIGVLIDTPTTLVEDTLIPQLRKTQESTQTVLKELNFPVVSSFVGSTDQKSIIVFELETTTLPKMAKHQGPPVEMEGPTEQFITSLSDEAQGPFIEDNRIVARVQREFTDVQDFLRSDSFLQQVSIGSDLKSVIESREIVSLKSNDEYLSKFSEAFTAELENLP